MLRCQPYLVLFVSGSLATCQLCVEVTHAPCWQVTQAGGHTCCSKAEAVAPKFLLDLGLGLDLEPSSADTQLPDLARA